MAWNCLLCTWLLAAQVWNRGSRWVTSGHLLLRICFLWLTCRRGPHACCTNLGRGTAGDTNPRYQHFSKVTRNHKHLGTLLKFGWLSPNSRDSVGAWELAFLTSSQMLLLLLVWGPHFENCSHLWKTFGTKWLITVLCFYVAGWCCHPGTTIFPFQGITHFLFPVVNPNSLPLPSYGAPAEWAQPASNS